MLCVSMAGQKMHPVLIGKSTNPRCFKKLILNDYNVEYYAYKTAWMKGDGWSLWLEKFDQLFNNQEKKYY